MTKPLSNVQVEILQSFNYSLSEEELTDFRNMLNKYFAEKISEEIDQVFDQENWDNSKLDEWAAEHMRTPYKSEKL